MFFIFADECGEGWISFDNSCYKLEPNPVMSTTPGDGQQYCSQQYGGHLFVPNSAEESAFIGNYIESVQVSILPLLLYKGVLRSF